MKVCIFRASSNNIKDIYIEETEKLGEALALNNHSLVFGGGINGLMGASYLGVKKQHGYVIAITPKIFNQTGFIVDEFDELFITKDMLERKQTMLTMADGFVAVPGGIGTFDELFDAYCANQVGTFSKPLILFNINEYYSKLWEYLNYSAAEGFIEQEVIKMCSIANTVEEVIELLDGGKK